MVQYGSSAKTHEQHLGVPVLRMGNITTEGNLLLNELKYLPANHPEFPELLLENGDLLFNRTNSAELVGKSAVYRGHPLPCSFASYLIRVRTTAACDSGFLAYCLNSLIGRAWIKSVVSQQVGQANVSGSKLQAFVFPLPPVSEQRRMVAEIEKQFTRLEAGVGALKRVQANLKRYRAAVLKAAVEGRLVPTEAELARREGRSYEPASELLVAQPLLAVLKKAQAGVPVPPKASSKEPAAPDTTDLPKLPEGWAWTTVECLGVAGEQPVLTGPFGTSMGRSDFTDSGIPVLTIGCLTHAGINLDKAVFVSRVKANELDRYRLQTGDMLFSRMATVGRAGVITNTLDGALFNYHLMRLRLSRNAVLPGFFMAYVRGSEAVETYVRDVNHGATRAGINTDQLLSMPVLLPPVAEQQRIVAEVERRLSVIDELEMQVETNLKRAERLRQAILKRAFEGKLVPQDPNDEPASMLLERIRNAGAAGGTATPGCAPTGSD
jgi:type I restriction enzyme S subunit